MRQSGRGEIDWNFRPEFQGGASDLAVGAEQRSPPNAMEYSFHSRDDGALSSGCNCAIGVSVARSPGRDDFLAPLSRFPRKGDEMPIYLDLADFSKVTDETSPPLRRN